MPQELQILQCYMCKTYQVDVVKKVSKFVCKLCGEKQSVQRIFGRGSGRDCRTLVQQLNRQRIEKEGSLTQTENENGMGVDERQCTFVIPKEQECGDQNNQFQRACSRWEEFVDEKDVLTELRDKSTSITSSVSRSNKRMLDEEVNEKNYANSEESKFLLTRKESEWTQCAAADLNCTLNSHSYRTGFSDEKVSTEVHNEGEKEKFIPHEQAVCSRWEKFLRERVKVEDANGSEKEDVFLVTSFSVPGKDEHESKSQTVSGQWKKLCANSKMQKIEKPSSLFNSKEVEARNKIPTKCEELNFDFENNSTDQFFQF